MSVRHSAFHHPEDLRISADDVLMALACGNPRCLCQRRPMRDGVVNGRTHCPLHHDPDPDLTVTEGADGKLRVHCFAGCEQNATFAAVIAAVTDRRRTASWKGRTARSPHESHGAGELPSEIHRQPDPAPWIIAAWNESQPDPDRVSAYLRSRGLSGSVPAALRFHPALSYEGARSYPAMLAAFRSLGGHLVGIHRTFLDPQGAGKAPVKPAKKFAGKTAGAAIRLFEPEGGSLAVTEGIETGLAVHEATGASLWVPGSAGGLAGVELPGSLSHLEIWADADSAGLQNGAYPLAERAAAQGCAVLVIAPEQGDWLDVLNAEGPHALRQARDQAAQWYSSARPDEPGRRRGRRAGRDDDGGGGDPRGRGGDLKDRERSGQGGPDLRLRVATAETATWYLTLPGCPEVKLKTSQLRSWEAVEIACNDRVSVPGWRPRNREHWQSIVDDLIKAANQEKVDEEFTALGNFRRILAHFCRNPESYPEVLDQGGVLQEDDRLCFRGGDLLTHIAGLPGNKLDRLAVFDHLRELRYQPAWKHVDGRSIRVVAIATQALIGDTEREADHGVS